MPDPNQSVDELALWRFGIIAPLLHRSDESLPLYREYQLLAQRPYQTPAGAQRHFSPDTFRLWLERYRRLGLAGTVAAAECGHAKTQRTCKRILKLKAALWMFVEAPGVDPTNNVAERTIRPYVLWRKMSFGTQSERGNLFVAWHQPAVLAPDRSW